MADRIRFQDRLWEHALANREIKPDKQKRTSTMADRIRFQDRLWEQSLRPGVQGCSQQQAIRLWSLPDKIRLHVSRDDC